MTAQFKPRRRAAALVRRLQNRQRYFWGAENKESSDAEVRQLAKRALKERRQ